MTAQFTGVEVHLIVTFDSSAELLSCYEIMKSGSTMVDPMTELPYSALAVQFIDKCGVQWGFIQVNYSYSASTVRKNFLWYLP
jgi:uncharacterized glyoxalase superfamily protein PhnB